MPEPRFHIRPTIRQEWIRYQRQATRTENAYLRAGVAGAYLPRLRLEVPHEPQERVSHSVPQCVAMVLRYYGLRASADWLACLLRTDDFYGTPGKRLEWLRGWGVQASFPSDLQLFRDGTVELNRRLGTRSTRLVYQWEERWLRSLRIALEEGIPPILFVDLGRLYSLWRGFEQPHAVVLTGGEGRQAWINDPSRMTGPVRVGLSTLMDSLLPGEPLAAFINVSQIGPGSSGAVAPAGGARPWRRG
jgi:hypothetical protein